MLEKMIFGRFIPGDSFIHRLDARAKLIFVFLFIAVVFIANNWITYGILVAFTFLIIRMSRIRLYFLINGLKPVVILIIFTFLLHLFFTREGAIIFEWKFVKIYEEGLRQGIFISIRFFVLVILTSILTLTTTPISITDALETLLNPLKKWKLPVHELALMMSISLRFIPTLMDETDKIMKAQMARGSDMTTGSMKERMNAIVPLLIPLFVSAFKRAEDLATAMEVRGYKGGEGRTRYRKLEWATKDTVIIVTLLILAIVLVYFRSVMEVYDMRLRAIISYDGNAFSGYQVQPGKRTVQLELERVLQIMHKGTIVKVVASGRTDAGVHATGQVIHFDSPLTLPMDRWRTALNVQLPGDIRVLSVEQVQDDFHARYDAIGKTYRYIWSLNEVHSPFERNYSVHVERYKPNIDWMKEASVHLLGTHDFSSFCAV